MLECEVCGKELKNYKSFSSHLNNKHKMTSKEYYDKFLKKSSDEGICKTCGKPTSYRGMTEGYRQFCSVKCATPQIQEKSRKTLIKRYGVTNFGQTPDAKIKAKKTMREKYGVDYYCNSKDCIEKAHSREAKKKAIQTNLKRYGHIHPSQSAKVKEKIRKTTLEKYGVDCFLLLPEVVEKTKASYLKYRQERCKNEK